MKEVGYKKLFKLAEIFLFIILSPLLLFTNKALLGFNNTASQPDVFSLNGLIRISSC